MRISAIVMMLKRETEMTPAELTAWRERMGLTKEQAAKALRLSLGGYDACERGWTLVYEGRGNLAQKAPHPIPNRVELLCAALETGITAGPDCGCDVNA